MAIVSFSRRLHELAQAQPDRPAVTCGSESVTRAQLVRRGDDLAVHLHAQGVGAGDMVTIAVPNSIDWFVAYLAAWRAGVPVVIAIPPAAR